MVELFRKKLRQWGPWAFARCMRNRGVPIEVTLHVMFPSKYELGVRI